jgi:multicomponent Na+:H+ antiporter subunit B
MTRRARTALFVPVGLALLAGLMAGTSGLPDVGQATSDYGAYVAHHLVHERGTTNVVAPLTFDLRAFDTLGEEFVLFAAAAACALLLRGTRGRPAPEDPDRPQDVPAIATPPLRLISRLLVAPTVVLGAYVVAHGTVTPGGGFQGGVILAAVALLLIAGGRAGLLRRGAPPSRVEAVEALGAGAFALLGVGGLVFATATFEDFLGNGTAGDLVSGGTILLANVAVGIEVMAGFALIFAELFEHAVQDDG